ncbi:MAG: hypothetical protein Ta2F_18250 [Termitinemataceae bacterium]|nr:MAG: hypothetical protein Ta2F_18250 [Termitinemataceae bacterium]
MYWWTVKDALRKYVNNGKWYCLGSDDPLMKERAWHGSEFRTVLAAMYYMNGQLDFSSGHTWNSKDGEEHSYTLMDDNAGM